MIPHAANDFKRMYYPPDGPRTIRCDVRDGCRPKKQRQRGHFVNIDSAAAKRAWPMHPPATATNGGHSDSAMRCRRQDPRNVAEMIRCLLYSPAGVVPKITIIPMRETSWP